jgi:hypothetical protein
MKKKILLGTLLIVGVLPTLGAVNAQTANKFVFSGTRQKTNFLMAQTASTTFQKHAQSVQSDQNARANLVSEIPPAAAWDANGLIKRITDEAINKANQAHPGRVQAGGLTIAITRAEETHSTTGTICRATVKVIPYHKNGAGTITMGTAAFRGDTGEEVLKPTLEKALERALKPALEEVPDDNPIVGEPPPPAPKSIPVTIENLRVNRGNWIDLKSGSVYLPAEGDGLGVFQFEYRTVDVSSGGFKGQLGLVARDATGAIFWVSDDAHNGYVEGIGNPFGKNKTRSYNWKTTIPRDVLERATNIACVGSSRGAGFWGNLKSHVGNAAEILKEAAAAWTNIGNTFATSGGSKDSTTSVMAKAGMLIKSFIQF